MGLTKQYLRFVPSEVFGLVGTNKSNVVFLKIRGSAGRYCAAGACEDVIVWDLRTGEKVTIVRMLTVKIRGPKGVYTIVISVMKKKTCVC